MTLKKIFHFGAGGLVGALLAVTIGLALLPYGKGLINLSYTLLFAPRAPIKTDDVVIVYMDDQSFKELNQSYIGAPWDRNLHAKLIDRLKADQAKAVVFDIVFSDPFTNNPTADQNMARAMKEFGKAIVAADYVKTAFEIKDVKSRTVMPPFDLISDAVASLGTDDVQTDDDFIIRKLKIGDKDDVVFPMSWAAAELAGARVTKITDPQQRFAERWVNYYGPPGHLPSISYYRAISDKKDEAPEPGFFRNKIVFVGARILTFLPGVRKDEYRTPYSLWQTESLFMAGVEVQATACLNLLRNDWLTRRPRMQEALIIMLYGLVFGAVLAQLRPVWAATTAAAGALFIAVSSYYAFKHFLIWSPWLIVVGAQIPAALLWSILFNSINLYVAGRLMEQSLSMYVSPGRVKQLKKNPAILKPGAEKQQLSILFSDIASFTAMSEGMDSDQLADLMNSYFEIAVNRCIHPAQGTVIKFIGDAIFAIWNAPEPQATHQELACRGGLLLRDSASNFHFGKLGKTVRTRIGLHCGVANVGNFGSSNRVDYTALGENINLASRMEGLNKYLGTDLLITGDLYSGVEDKFVTRFCGRFQLKGFERAVKVHELLSTPDQAEASKAWREAYADALKHFEKKDLETAEAGFQGVLKLHPNDGPAQFFLHHIAEIRAHPPDGEWDGSVELKEK